MAYIVGATVDVTDAGPFKLSIERGLEVLAGTGFWGALAIMSSCLVVVCVYMCGIPHNGDNS